jgi:C-terminal novel E3 ligase, LRR-interacting
MRAFIEQHAALVKPPAAFARQLIMEYAKNHWGLDIDPDTARIETMTYSDGVKTPHPATLMHSWTLTEALLNNWQQKGDGHLFSGLGELQPYQAGGVPMQIVTALESYTTVRVYEGLYRQRTPQTYDASTHLNIPAADFKRFVWNAKLRHRYLAYLDSFWKEYAALYPLLGKVSFIKAAYLQRVENSLHEADKQLALRAVGLSPLQRWEDLTPEQLQAITETDQQIVIAPLKIYKYFSSDMLVIKDRSRARVLLYIPGNSSPLHGFDNELQLKDWLGEQCRDPGKRQALEGHFKASDDGDGLFLSGVRRALNGMAVYPRILDSATGTWPPRHTLHLGPKIRGDAFVHVRNSIEAQLKADANVIIRTRGDARKHALTQGVSNSLVFVGFVALIAPEAIPFILGLSGTLMALGAEQLIKGSTLESKQEGGERIVFGLLNALPLAAEKVIRVANEVVDARLVHHAVEVSVPQVSVTAPEGVDAIPLKVLDLTVNEILPRALEPIPPNLNSLSPELRQSLKAFEAPSAYVQGAPNVHGPNGVMDIHHREGRYFLRVHDKAYQVHWDSSARQWRIRSPEGSGKPGPFVRQLPTGVWDLDIGGLRGGRDLDHAVSSREAAVTPPSLHAQVQALYPGFSHEQVLDFIGEVRASGFSVEIQLRRLSTEFETLTRRLERWVTGPVRMRQITDTRFVAITETVRRQAADIILRCWQRQTPIEGVAARFLDDYTLNLSGLGIGDLPELPGDFSHVTGVSLARTHLSAQDVNAVIRKCPNLHWLNLEGNLLYSVPVGIRNLPNLTRLTLANNRIVLSPDMLQTLTGLRQLRLLNLDGNPIGPLLDVRGMPQLLNLFLRDTGIDATPVGVFELPNILALDLRGNRITSLPDLYYEMPDAANHSVLDGNPLSPATRARIAQIGGPLASEEQVESVELWLTDTRSLDRVRRRSAWQLFEAEPYAEDFFGVIARLRGSSDFRLARSAVAERVWQVLEAGAGDPALRCRLIAMAAHPETCVDGATVMFSNMELEVLISNARSTAVAGREGPQLLKLVRGLFRLEEVDRIARLDVALRPDFAEDVEVLLAYRIGLVDRLELPLGARTMQFSNAAGVDQAALDQAAAAVLSHETPAALIEFALKRDFWIKYLESEYAPQFLAIRQPTALRMEALDDLQSRQPMSDGDYKNAAEQILRQRRADEEALMTQLTQAELDGGPGANIV